MLYHVPEVHFAIPRKYVNVDKKVRENIGQIFGSEIVICLYPINPQSFGIFVLLLFDSSVMKRTFVSFSLGKNPSKSPTTVV